MLAIVSDRNRCEEQFEERNLVPKIANHCVARWPPTIIISMSASQCEWIYVFLFFIHMAPRPQTPIYDLFYNVF